LIDAGREEARLGWFEAGADPRGVDLQQVESGGEQSDPKSGQEAEREAFHRPRESYPRGLARGSAAGCGILEEQRSRRLRRSQGRNDLMTQLLERALEEVRKLSATDQDAIASLILEEIQDEQLWDETFARSQDKLARMAAKAREDIRAGKVRNLEIDEL
jgi:hypothetical protein